MCATTWKCNQPCVSVNSTKMIFQQMSFGKHAGVLCFLSWSEASLNSKSSLLVTKLIFINLWRYVKNKCMTEEGGRRARLCVRNHEAPPENSPENQAWTLHGSHRPWKWVFDETTGSKFQRVNTREHLQVYSSTTTTTSQKIAGIF